MDLENRSDLLETKEIQCLIDAHPGITSMQILNCVFTVPTSIAATLANVLVIISIWRTPSLHSPSNILLVGLALSDMAVGLVAQPIFFADSFAKIQNLPGVLCGSSIANHFTGYSLCGVSFLTLTVISLDRYIAIQFHLRYGEIVGLKRVIAVLLFIWIFCILCPFWYLWSPAIFDYFVVSMIIVCFAVTAFIYCRIFLVVRRHQTQINSQLQATQSAQQSENAASYWTQLKKTVINTLVIFWVFFLCYFPYATVVVLIVIFGHTAPKEAAVEFTTLLIHFNSTLNPFVYCWRYRHIRTAVFETARCYWEKICTRTQI